MRVFKNNNGHQVTVRLSAEKGEICHFKDVQYSERTGHFSVMYGPAGIIISYSLQLCRESREIEACGGCPRVAMKYMYYNSRRGYLKIWA